MDNFSHKKTRNAGVMQVNVDPPPTPLIKINHTDKSDKDFIKLKLHAYLTSEKLDLYEFKMDLFDNGEPEEFLLFVLNFNTTLAASVTIETDSKV